MFLSHFECQRCVCVCLCLYISQDIGHISQACRDFSCGDTPVSRKMVNEMAMSKCFSSSDFEEGSTNFFPAFSLSLSVSHKTESLFELTPSAHICFIALPKFKNHSSRYQESQPNRQPLGPHAAQIAACIFLPFKVREQRALFFLFS